MTENSLSKWICRYLFNCVYIYVTFLFKVAGKYEGYRINHRKTFTSNAFNHHLYNIDIFLYWFLWSCLSWGLGFKIQPSFFTVIFPSLNPTGSSNSVVQINALSLHMPQTCIPSAVLIRRMLFLKSRGGFRASCEGVRFLPLKHFCPGHGSVCSVWVIKHVKIKELEKGPNCLHSKLSTVVIRTLF